MKIGIILAIILLLLIIMVCVPLSYRASIQYEEKLDIECHARWIGKLFRFHFHYIEGETYQREFYLLGKLRWGAAKDYQRWLSKRAKEALEDDEITTSQGQKGMPLTLNGDNSIAIQEEEWLKRQIENAKLANEPPCENEAENANCEENAPEDAPKEPCENSQENSQSKSSIKDYPEKIEAFFNKLNSKKEKYSWILDKSVWQAFFTLAAKLYRHSKPKYWDFSGIIGLGDPAYTAMVAGVLYACMPANSSKIRFEYLDPIAKGHISCKGRLYLPVVLWFLIEFLWTKPIRQFILKK